MLTDSQITEQLAIYQRVGKAHYCPLVSSATAAAELFLLISLVELKRYEPADTERDTPTRIDIPFRFAFELASRVKIGATSASETAQVERFLNSMRTAVYRLRERAGVNNSAALRKFKILYRGFEIHEGPIDDRPLVRCAIVNLTYSDSTSYNSLASNATLRQALTL